MPARKKQDSELAARAEQGDRSALNELFALHRARLRRMVDLRLDSRLRSRIDASDVIQEAFLEASTRYENFVVEKKIPLFLWLRILVGERLITLHRHHLGVKMRSAEREVSLYREALPEASSAALAAQLIGQFTSPSQAVLKAERTLRLQSALNTMEEIDREVLSLRHFEQLTRSETAQVLGIGEAAAGKRYLRALKRLKEIMRDTSLGGEPHERE